MKTLIGALAAPALLFSASAAFAQAYEYEAPRYPGRSYYQDATYQPATTLPQQELDRILAPIALYPDSLLSQLLMAATYPRDVAEAARWSRANPGLQGDEAVRAVENEPWHPSVKSLAAFPEVLAALGDQPGWTARLGQAFLAQESAVMRTVQQLRRRADEAGNLHSTDRIVVERIGSDYVIEPPSTEVVYVPYYDPRVVYGRWWWPAYEPVFWSPWPGYAYYGGFGWGPGVHLTSGFFFGHFDWPRRHVRYASHRPYYWHGHPGRHWRDDRRDHRRDGRHWRDDRRDGRDGRDDGRWRAGPRERPQYVDGTRPIQRPGREWRDDRGGRVQRPHAPAGQPMHSAPAAPRLAAQPPRGAAPAPRLASPAPSLAPPASRAPAAPRAHASGNPVRGGGERGGGGNRGGHGRGHER